MLWIVSQNQCSWKAPTLFQPNAIRSSTDQRATVEMLHKPRRSACVTYRPCGPESAKLLELGPVYSASARFSGAFGTGFPSILLSRYRRGNIWMALTLL